MLCYSALRKTVHGELLLDIDYLEVHEQACVALSGRNGVGKSTLMRIMAGLEKPDSGTVTLDGRTFMLRRAGRLLRSHVIYLHQNAYLFDRTVTDNIAYGLRQRKLPIREVSRRVSEALDWAGIGHLQLRNARELSGGERQRVAFARARILSPHVLLLDEPTTNMDSEAREQTYRMIRRLKEEGVSIIVATHEYHTIAHLCDGHLALQAGTLQPQPTEPAEGERKVIPYC